MKQCVCQSGPVRRLCSMFCTLVPLCGYPFHENRFIEAEVAHITRSLIPQIYECCERNQDIFSLSKNRRRRCKDLDELGGQPLISQSIVEQAEKWMVDNMGFVSRFYLKTLPKTKLLIDRQKKERQDNVMEVVCALRDNVFYAYCENRALKLDDGKFQEMAKAYKKLMQMGSWRDIGDRQNAKAIKSARALCKQIEVIHLLNIEAFDTIIEAKKGLSATFQSKHPDSTRTAYALQRARKAEMRAMSAENDARRARRMAADATSRASEAEARAAEAESQAWSANRRAQDAERKALFGY